jgi:hypothetical protein
MSSEAERPDFRCKMPYVQSGVFRRRNELRLSRVKGDGGNSGFVPTKGTLELRLRDSGGRG